MKKLSFLIVALLFTSIGFSQTEPGKSKKTKIDIYYFHRTIRCETCNSIEKNTIKALDLYFADELKDGSIEFHSIDYQFTVYNCHSGYSVYSLRIGSNVQYFLKILNDC